MSDADRAAEAAATALATFRELVSTSSRGLAGSVELVATALSPDAQRLLRLGALPHGFDVEVAQTLMPDVKQPELLAAFEEMLVLSFVSTDGLVAHLHDNVRGYLIGRWMQARERDPEAWKCFLEANDRLAQYFAEVAATKQGEAAAVAARNRVFHTLAFDPDRGFSLFEEALKRERIAFRLDACETLIKLVAELDLLLTPTQRGWLDLHRATLHLDLHRAAEAAVALRALLETPAARSDGVLRRRALVRLGVACRELMEPEAARDAFRSVIADASEEDSADAVLGLASLHIDSDAPETAEPLLDRLLASPATARDLSVQAQTWNAIGMLHRRLGHPQRAEDAFIHALAALDAAGEQFRPLQVHNNIGLLHAERANWEEAHTHLERAANLAREAGDSQGEAFALANLQRVHLALGREQAAIVASERAVALFTAIHAWAAAAKTSRGLARIHRRASRSDEARASLVRAAELFRLGGAADDARDCEEELSRLDRRGRSLGFYVLISLLVAAAALTLLIGAMYLLRPEGLAATAL